MSDIKYAPTPTDPPPSYTPSSPPASAPNKPPPLRGPLPLDIPSLNYLRANRIVLASASPRRKQLLAQIGITNPIIHPSLKPENLSKTALSPFEYVLRTATQKALDVYTLEIDSPHGTPALVLAADTIVLSPTAQILEKPRSEAAHIAMLRALRSPTPHKVITAVAAMAPLESARDPGYVLETCVEETRVWFDAAVSDEVLWAYVRTREGCDKAGGYGIQGVGALLVERIEGSWDNVVGLPLKATLGVLERVLARRDDDGGLIDEFLEAEEEEE